LIDALTTREHLVLFARIKGLPEAEIPTLVVAKMKEMDLLDFADKAAGSLSGGNQRKVSMAIATMADPLVVFADEPSTGKWKREGGREGGGKERELSLVGVLSSTFIRD